MYRVQVKTVSCADGVFTGNANVYKTKDAAIDAAKDLFSRWFAVEKWRVIDDNNKTISEGP